MDKGKIRLGRFDKWGYKNSFSKGELARELVYTNEDNDSLKQALNEIREYINSDADECCLGEDWNGMECYLKDECCGKEILLIIDKALGDEKVMDDEIKCLNCIKFKTQYCPCSIDCMATNDYPYFQDKFMLLEENYQKDKAIDECIELIKKFRNEFDENDYVYKEMYKFIEKLQQFKEVSKDVKD